MNKEKVGTILRRGVLVAGLVSGGYSAKEWNQSAVQLDQNPGFNTANTLSVAEQYDLDPAIKSLQYTTHKDLIYQYNSKYQQEYHWSEPIPNYPNPHDTRERINTIRKEIANLHNPDIAIISNQLSSVEAKLPDQEKVTAYNGKPVTESTFQDEIASLQTVKHEMDELIASGSDKSLDISVENTILFGAMLGSFAVAGGSLIFEACEQESRKKRTQ